MLIALVFLLLVFVFLLWKVPKKQVERSKVTDLNKRFELENEARKVLAEIFGGVLLIVGLYSTAETLKLSRDTQITERLTNAFGQLANDEYLEARLGGIYSLERLAQDSERDHWTVMEVLTQFVRERASEERHNNEVEAYSDQEKAWGLFPWPPPDVQAALTVIGRRSNRHRHDENEWLDLHETVLVGARLTGAHLEKANLSGVDFGGSLLSPESGGRFPGITDLSGAHLQKAILDDAYLGRSNISGAHLDGASLRGADLSQVVGLTQQQLNTACISPTTLLPPNTNLSRPKPCLP